MMQNKEETIQTQHRFFFFFFHLWNSIQLQNGKSKACSLVIFWTPASTVCLLYMIGVLKVKWYDCKTDAVKVGDDWTVSVTHLFTYNLKAFSLFLMLCCLSLTPFQLYFIFFIWPVQNLSWVQKTSNDSQIIHSCWIKVFCSVVNI